MSEYEIAYRLYSSAEINTYGSIGEATIRKRGKQSVVDGELVFTVEAESKSQASKKAEGKYQNQARTIVGILSYISDEGVILGQAYPPILADKDVKSKTDLFGQLDDLAIDIANDLFDTVNTELDQQEHAIRALHWYGIGLNTETPEDRLIAFWTGLEAAVEPQTKYSGEELEAYEEAKEQVKDIVEDHDDLHGDLMSIFGFGKKESIAEALTRVFADELDAPVGISGIERDVLEEKIGEMKDARVDIVHYGKSVKNAEAKARDAKKLLKAYLDEALDDSYLSLLDADSSIDIDQSRRPHPVIDSEPAIDKVFEGIEDESLSEQEIRKRLFAVFRDYQTIHRFKLENMVGASKPLDMTPDGKYRHSPPPDWFTATHEAILQYTYAAGRVPLEVI
ncbi:HEPN domain-containing protein, partial [Halalkaliarchaeum sp. AArc-GB]|uniref:HEPN domain-containing protein n=1 Tax=Halalkaliarchaeum sp. AArc-GB TaxID=3074078 RepID=UPI002866980A